MIRELSLQEVRRFRAAILERLGLHFDETKLDFLSEILRDRLEARPTLRVSAYLDGLSGREAREEWRALAERLTVGETYFFRYAEQFRAYSEVVLSDCARSGAASRELRLLSAGCASGEEPYSLAVLLRERQAELFPGWQVRIEGVDVSPVVLERARRGRYSEWSLRQTSPELRERYFRRAGRDYELDGAVRSMVSLEERNLVEHDPLFWKESAFDVVFCRNVIMYFSPEVARQVVSRIARLLRPEGYLFLGHAETLRALSDEFHLRHTHGTFYYQRQSSHESRGRVDSDRSPGISFPSATAVLDSAGTWVEAIQKASERIAELAGGKASPAPRTGVVGALEDRPAGAGGPGPRPWDLGLALDLLRNEKFSEAMDFLRGLPPESTVDADAQLLRAVLLTNTGALKDAQKVCQDLLRANELDAGAHYLMALCLEHQGDPKAALEHDQTAVYLDPAFAMPHFHLGLLAKREGSLDQARGELEQALALLVREDPSRILLFGGGFSRDALVELCRGEVRACGGRT